MRKNPSRDIRDRDIYACIYDCRKPLDALKEFNKYRSLEEQGKLLKLPCKVGDAVYRICDIKSVPITRIYECKVVGIKQEYNTVSVKLYANINEENYSIWIDDWFDKCQVGFEFFLTQEQAENALKEMKERDERKRGRE